MLPPISFRERRRVSDRRTLPHPLYAGPERRQPPDDRRRAGLHAIARSFGLRAEHLEVIGHHEVVDGMASCVHCDGLSRRCAELEQRLAASEALVAHCQREIEALRGTA